MKLPFAPLRSGRPARRGRRRFHGPFRPRTPARRRTTRPRPPGRHRVAARHRGRRRHLHRLPAADRQVRRHGPRGPRRRPGPDSRGRQDADDLRRHLDQGQHVHRQGDPAGPARRHPDHEGQLPDGRRGQGRRSTSTSSAATSEQGRTISLARIEANLAIAQADKKGNAVPLKNDPPRIYYRTSPAILDHDRRRPGPARRRGLGPPARAQLAQPDPEGRERVLHADRRTAGSRRRP